MSRIKWAFRPVPMVLASAIVVGLAFEPRMLARRWDDALFASWRALGELVASRELDAIGRQFERDREEVERIETLRDDLDVRRRSLAARRAMAADRAAETRSPHPDGGERELARIDSAIALLDSAVARADAALAEVRRDLREHEAELIALEASADAIRLDRQLAGALGDRTSWPARLARARDVLRTMPPDGGEPAGGAGFHADEIAEYAETKTMRTGTDRSDH